MSQVYSIKKKIEFFLCDQYGLNSVERRVVFDMSCLRDKLYN